MVVVAVGAVHMPLGHHGDGDGAATGRGCGGGRMAVIVTMPMIVGVVVTMVMLVPMSMPPMVVPAAMPCCISTAFGLKRHVLLRHDQVHRAQHVGQHMVGFDL